MLSETIQKWVEELKDTLKDNTVPEDYWYEIIEPQQYGDHR